MCRPMLTKVIKKMLTPRTQLTLPKFKILKKYNGYAPNTVKTHTLDHNAFAVVFYFRVFTQAKPRYQTEPERRGFSWVFEGHVTNKTATVVATHPEGGHWRAVRNATWYQVLPLFFYFFKFFKNCPR